MAKQATASVEQSEIQWGKDSKLQQIAELELEQAEQEKAVAAAQAKIAEAQAQKRELETAEARERLDMLSELLSAERIAARIAPLVKQHIEARRACVAVYREYRALLDELQPIVAEASQIHRQLEPESSPAYGRTIDRLIRRIVRETEQAMRADVKNEVDQAALRFALDATGVAY